MTYLNNPFICDIFTSSMMRKLKRFIIEKVISTSIVDLRAFSGNRLVNVEEISGSLRSYLRHCKLVASTNELLSMTDPTNAFHPPFSSMLLTGSLIQWL